MPILFLVLLIGFVCLVASANRFVLGAAALARNLGVSALVVGLTVVGFGTSAPEILVSALASWQGNPGLAVGNALGSNIANIGLILGSTALLSPLLVCSHTLRRELLILLTVSLGCYGLSLDGTLGRFDGCIMLVGLLIFLIWMVCTARRGQPDALAAGLAHEVSVVHSLKWSLGWTLAGLLGLLLSSRLLVWAASQIAQQFGVSDLVIGLTIVAVGTSLPELAASMAAVLKRESDLAIGNVIGSNIYNLLAVYSMPGMIHPGTLEASVLTRDFPWVLGLTGILFLLTFGFFKRQRIGRLEGTALTLAFAYYQWQVFQSASQS